MLTRVLALFFVVGLVAGASWNNNNQGTYRDQPNRDGQQYGHQYGQQQYDPSRPRPYEQNQPNSGYNNQNLEPNYNRNQDVNNYDNRHRNINNEDGNIYAKNQTSIFCYVNGTRIKDLVPTESSNYNNNQRNSEIMELNSCTHVVLGVGTLKHNFQIEPLGDFTSEAASNKFSFNNLSDLKKRNIKVLVSISGDPRLFSAMANEHRITFIRSVHTFMRSYHLDGVNIDWQWPVGPSSSSRDRDNYITLLTELKREDRSKLVTMFVPPEDLQIRELFEDYAKFHHEGDIVDYFILMALEMRGHNFQRIEHHAPVDSYNSAQTVSKAISSIRRNVPPQNLYQFVLAIPFYGKRYQLENRMGTQYREESPMNKPFSRVHSHYQAALIATYPQVCRDTVSYTHGYDETNESPYAVHDTVVYVYEDARSVREKTKLAMQNGFGGVMAYSIDMDDIQGECQRRSTDDRRQSYGGSYSQRYPLLQAMADQVQRGSANAFHSSPLAIAFAVVCALILKVNN